MSLRTIMIVVALIAGLSGCSARKIWVEGEVDARNEDILWDSALASLAKAGYPVGVGADPGKREIRTGWMKSAAPFKGRGYRQRATFTYGRLESQLYNVRVRVERERNDSFQPLTHGKWVADGDDEEQAQIVLQYIKSTLGGGELEIGAPPADPFKR